jgi:hypothetical protein
VLISFALYNKVFCVAMSSAAAAAAEGNMNHSVAPVREMTCFSLVPSSRALQNRVATYSLDATILVARLDYIRKCRKIDVWQTVL